MGEMGAMRANGLPMANGFGCIIPSCWLVHCLLAHDKRVVLLTKSKQRVYFYVKSVGQSGKKSYFCSKFCAVEVSFGYVK